MRVQAYHPTCLKTPVSIYTHAWESENDWSTNNKYWFQQLIINFGRQSPGVMYVLLFNELAVEGDGLNMCKGQKDLRRKQSLKQARLEERTKIHGGHIFFWPILALAMFWFNDLNCADMVPNVLTGMGCNPLGYNFHEMFGLMSSHVDGFVFNDTAGVRVTKPSPCFFYQTRGYFWLQ